jgi:hypothetical protein
MGGAPERVTQWRPLVERQREGIRDLLESISGEREERAAIYEYDANMSRREAEERAGIRRHRS